MNCPLCNRSSSKCRMKVGLIGDRRVGQIIQKTSGPLIEIKSIIPYPYWRQPAVLINGNLVAYTRMPVHYFIGTQD